MPPAPRRLLFVTSNAGKLREAQAQLAPLGITVEQRQVPYPELQADTLDEVARFGAPFVAGEVEGPFILEDSGLFVDALKGFPGVYSAYALATIGLDGILAVMAAVEDKDRTARFESRVLYRDGSGKDHLFAGSVAGRIGRAARGDKGFGYDPIFIPDEGDGRSFGEFESEEKALLSHRGRAIAALSRHLADQARE